MPSIQVNNFAGGQTLQPSVLADAPRVMKTIDGFWIERGVATPREGTTKVGTPSALALKSQDHQPYVGRFGAYPWLIASDSNSKIRWWKIGQSTAWSDAVADLAGLPPADSACVKYDRWQIIPGSGGVRRWEPAYAEYILGLTNWTAATAYVVGDVVSGKAAGSYITYEYECTSAHTSSAAGAAGNEPGVGATWTTYWRYNGRIRTVDLDIPAPTIAPILSETSGTYAIFEECEDVWDTVGPIAGCTESIGTEDDRAGYLRCNINWPTGSIGANTECCAEALDAVTNLQNATVTFDFAHFAGDPSPWQGIQVYLIFYADAACTSAIEVIPIDDGSGTPGDGQWHTASWTFGNDAALITTRGIGIFTGPSWSASKACIIGIDNIRVSSFAATSYWDTTANYYEYQYCYAAPEAHTGSIKRWIISPASKGVMTSQTVDQGDKVTVTCYIDSAAIAASEITHILLYRRRASNPNLSEWEYVAAIDIRNYQSAASIDYDDYGAVGDYDEDLFLPQYLEFNHDAAPQGKLAMSADGKLFLGCVMYSGAQWYHPLGVWSSTYLKPTYFPYNPREGEEDTDGAFHDLSQRAENSSELRAMLEWQSRKLFWTDAELFWLQGTAADEYQWVRVGGVGARNQRVVVSCEEEAIWLSSQGFYSYSGSGLKNISFGLIDHTLIDTTKPMSAVYWQRRYILFCTYNSVPCAVCYSQITTGWTVHSLTNMPLAGAACDRKEDRIYGLTRHTDNTAFPVRLFDPSGTTDVLASTGAATQTITRTVETQKFALGPSTREWLTERFVTEIDVSNTSAVTATLATTGLYDKSQEISMSWTTAATSRETPVNLNGHAFSMKLTSISVYLSNLIAMALDLHEEPHL